LTSRPSLVRPSALLAVALALAAGGLGFRAADAHAARGMEIAIQDDAALVTQSYQKYHLTRDRALRFARAFGVTRVKVNLVWANTLTPSQRRARTRPADLQYQFGGVDDTVDAAAKYGMRVHLSLTGPAPAWAAGNRKVGPYKPSVAAFTEWADIVARHFRYRVDRYSIWNEPNLRAWLAPLGSSASIYRRLYPAAYKAIKRAAPEAKVLIGETSPYGRRGFAAAPIAWLRQVLCVNTRGKRKRSCPKLKADGYAHHPYDFAHAANFRFPGKDNATMGTLGNLTRALDLFSRRGALRRNGGGRMPVYLTEYGYFATGRRALSKRKRTKYLAQGWSIALKNGRVRSNLQYLLASPPRRSTSAYFDLALLSTRGKKYPQYNTMVRWYKAHRRQVKRPGRPISLIPAPPT
jgi:Cellulase (glycosyl hydrolase family 5)